MTSEENETEFGRPDERNPLLRWREYLYIFYERRWIAITTFVVIVASTLIWNARQTPLYRASARLQIDMSAERILNIPDFSAPGTPGYMFGQYMMTQVKALRSRTFVEEVAKTLAASEDPEVKAIASSPPDLAARIMSGLSVAPVEGTLLIDVTVADPSPEATATFANAIVEQFIQKDRNRRMDTAMSALNWLSKQAEDQKAKVTASELALQNYRETSGMVSLEDRQDIVVSKLKAVNGSLTSAETVLAAAQSQKREIDYLSEQGTKLSNIPAIVADPQVVTAKKRVVDLQTRVASLKLRYKEKHPTLLAAEAELAEAVSAFYQVCNDVRTKIERAYQVAKSNVEGLRAALKEQEGQSLALSRALVEYSELKRNAEADRELYESILTRMKETALAGKLETTNMRLNDHAHVPVSPFKPNAVRNILRASGVGGLLGILLVLIVNVMDDRIRRVEDFELSLGVPVLALIPRIDLDTDQDRATVVFNDDQAQSSEAFRGLRASILLDQFGREARCIMIVSASASEGKSQVSSNLASMFAKNGERTLLLDCDMRRPSIHKLFDLQDKKGLPHLLAGERSLEEVVVSSPLSNHLDILPGVGAPRDPAPVLTAPRLGPVLKQIRERYDRVIIIRRQ